LRRSGAVDLTAHIRRHPDIALSGLNPLVHYVEHVDGGERHDTDGRRALPSAPQLEEAGGFAGTAIAASIAPAPATAATAVESPQVLIRIQGVVERNTPAGAKLAVVSGGDERLLQLPGRTTWHFPRTPSGGHRAGNPVDTAEIVRW